MGRPEKEANLLPNTMSREAPPSTENAVKLRFSRQLGALGRKRKSLSLPFAASLFGGEAVRCYEFTLLVPILLA